MSNLDITQDFEKLIIAVESQKSQDVNKMDCTLSFSPYKQEMWKIAHQNFMV